ncbi:SHOCT domain-containing protein [Nocardioides sp. TRM66260-LWL]|uniref:SHOCT domain-containing protein n=1 Tax=Nocardioides sp. TRM66260-LWL TaxID=2874478 RepID=UPI001CC6608D|nr:SHOCT domain-containing protein [Nocardioides sp. TRM66260-LWL]MBZ5736405.1 SHOCT domain-containing protein [Nocardioides sp. TRM66260-LWL]
MKKTATRAGGLSQTFIVPAVESQSGVGRLRFVMMGSGGMWLWMILGLAALWALVACAIRCTIGPRKSTPEQDPIKVLDARLARGEITSEEYRRVRDLLATGH